jgi:hypothetical protein
MPFPALARRSLLSLLTSALLVSFGWSSPAEARGAVPGAGPSTSQACFTTCVPFRVREQDAVWAISTRHLGCCHAFTPYVWKFVGGQWYPSSLQAFYAEDSADVVTSVYVHGNRIDSAQALSDGLQIYFQLVGRYDHLRPTRFVIWSWPSSQIHGPLRDVRAKAQRTDIDGYFFAQWMSGMQSDVQVGLLGYSYGARIITGALHLLGGGQLCGRTVPGGNRQPTQVVLWAAALHNYWLLPGQYHGCALPMANRWAIYINGCDPVLQRYRMLDKWSRPEALGYTGMVGMNQLPPEIWSRIEHWQVSHVVGRVHDMRRYLYAPGIAGRTTEILLWHAGAALAEQREKSTERREEVRG